MNRSTSLITKITRFRYGILFWFLIIIMQLMHLQIVRHHDFYLRATKNFSRILPINSLRGTIVDCNGIPLATNRPVLAISWKGSGLRRLTEKQVSLINEIHGITQKELTPDQLSAIAYAERTKQIIPLLIDINHENLCRIAETYPNHENLEIVTLNRRFYPFHHFACHVLGYINLLNVETIGKMGLEKIFEEQLQGQHGATSRIINSIGMSLHETIIRNPFAGNTISTTLDLTLQAFVERSFSKKLSGAVVILDPQDGAIKALVSRPSFDPNIFLNPMGIEDWTDMQKNHAFLNRAINAAYPPASIFKIVTLATAYQEGFIHEDTMSLCNGYTHFYGRKYHCNKRTGHGEISMIDALIHSCNPPFYELGKKISIDTLAAYAQRFGLGSKTQILFNEQAGLVPTRAWKYQTKGERWWLGETLSATIGQSYLLATPLQIARMIGSIFTGYLVKPRILTQETPKFTPLEIDYRTRKFLKHALKRVITEGTAKPLSNIEELKIYGKTGTAQVHGLDKRRLDNQIKAHAWGVVYFQYPGHDPLVMVILLEHMGGAKAAVSLAKSVLIRYRDQCRQESFQHYALSCANN